MNKFLKHKHSLLNDLLQDTILNNSSYRINWSYVNLNRDYNKALRLFRSLPKEVQKPPMVLRSLPSRMWLCDEIVPPGFVVRVLPEDAKSVDSAGVDFTALIEAGKAVQEQIKKERDENDLRIEELIKSGVITKQQYRTLWQLGASPKITITYTERYGKSLVKYFDDWLQYVSGLGDGDDSESAKAKIGFQLGD